MIRFNAIIFAGWILTISCLAQESYEDVVYLKDGSIIRGMIIEQIPGKTIKVQTRDGNVFVYSINLVTKITKELALQRRSEQTEGPSLGAFGLRGNVGTGVQGNLGFGGGVTFAWMPQSSTAYEFGIDVFFSEINDHYTEGFGTRTEALDLLIVGGRVNWLWNLRPDRSSFYLITGFGFAVAAYDWALIDDTGYSPGTGQSLDEDEGTVAGNVINLGAGWSTASGFGARLETPLLYFYGAGDAVAFVPMFTFSLTFRF